MSGKTLGMVVLGTVGGLVFALGMCMCLVPEWGLFNPGVAAVAVGVVLLGATYVAYRRSHPRARREPADRAVLAAFVVGVVGMLALGVGMSLVLVGGASGGPMLLGGMALGVAGLLACILNYPVFSYRRKGGAE